MKKNKLRKVNRTTLVKSSTSGVPGESSGQMFRASRSEFFESIAEVLRAARSNAYRAVNFVMVEAYWNIGRTIVEEEQQGKDRAEYGSYLLKNLAAHLATEFGKAWSRTA